MNEKIILGVWSKEELNRLLAGSSKIKNIGRRIVFLSGKFLGAPYVASTLIGDAATPEIPVINLAAFDCFTFLDCVEAMRLSQSFEEFCKNLVRIRYKGGHIRYERRNHFFTDWSFYNRGFILDATVAIGGKKARTVAKILNRTDDGPLFLAGIRPFKRTISYIPSDQANEKIRLRLKTGDYIGIYSDLAGLDVSHVGIVVKDGPAVSFRHASSAAGKVVEEDFARYISDKPGVVVFRPC